MSRLIITIALSIMLSFWSGRADAGAIYVVDPCTVRPQAIEIDGNQPTPTEQQRIDRWIADRKAECPPAKPVQESATKKSRSVFDGETDYEPSLRTCMAAAENGNLIKEKEDSYSTLAYKGRFYFIWVGPTAMRCVTFEPRR